MFKKNHAFTLIELLVVIAIIGILSTVVISQIDGARTRARNSTAKGDVVTAGKAIEIYKNDPLNNGRVIAAIEDVTATNPGGIHTPMGDTTALVLLNDCQRQTLVGGVLVLGDNTCNISNVDSASADQGSFKLIFTGKKTIVTGGNGNTYPANIDKSPGTGYMYYYMTEDSSTATPTGSQAASAVDKEDYYFIADLGTAGAAINGDRFYYIRKGATGSFAGATFKPSFQ